MALPDSLKDTVFSLSTVQKQLKTVLLSYIVLVNTSTSCALEVQVVRR